MARPSPCRLAELLQSKQSDSDRETANSLHALVQGGGKKRTPVSPWLHIIAAAPAA